MKAALLLMGLAAPAWAQVSFSSEALPSASNAASAPSAPPKGGFVAEERKPLPPEAEATLREINAYRAQGASCGTQRYEPAPPLQWNEALQRAARVQAQHMGRQGTVTHDGPDGSSVGQRVTREGYEWGNVGENAAAGRHTAGATLAQWMASPGHCRNMMGAAFREVAVVGVSAGGPYGSYWVMVLAAPLR
jgi:uncharacterized protein YkwD